MKYYDDYDYWEHQDYNIKDIKSIVYLHELRHLSNIFGTNVVAVELNVDIKRINKLYNSEIHGSKKINKILKLDDAKFNGHYSSLVNESRQFQKQKEEKENLKYELIADLHNARTSFCGVGTMKVKRTLNKLIIDVPLANILRKLLELEDINIKAKDSYSWYQAKLYDAKQIIILELIDLYLENNLIVGYNSSDEPNIPYIIYFELPNKTQISFHCKLDNNILIKIPKYLTKWDGKHNSTLPKLEEYLLNDFKIEQYFKVKKPKDDKL